MRLYTAVHAFGAVLLAVVVCATFARLVGQVTDQANQPTLHEMCQKYVCSPQD